MKSKFTRIVLLQLIVLALLVSACTSAEAPSPAVESTGTSVPPATASAPLPPETPTPVPASATPVSVTPTDTATPTPVPEPVWTTYTTGDGLIDDRVEDVAVAPDGTVWVATRSGVSRFSPSQADPTDGQWVSYTSADGLAYDYVQAVALASDGTPWFGTGGYKEGGVSRYAGGSWTTFTEEDGLVNDWVLSLAVDPDGGVWIGTIFGLSYFGGGRWLTYLEGQGIEALAIAPDGGVWAGSDEGLFYYDGQDWTTFTRRDGLAGDYVVSLAVGPEGGLWAGTFEAGLSRYDGDTWRTYTVHDGLGNDTVWDIAVGADGALWLATDDGLSRYAHSADGGDALWTEAWLTYTPADGLAHPVVTAIAVAPDGALWLGTWQGLNRYYLPPDAPPAQPQVARTPPPLTPVPTPTRTPRPSATPRPPTATATPGPSPTPWPKSPADWTSYTNVNQISDLAFDQDGYLWSTSDGGVVRWNVDDGSYTRYGVEHGLVDHRVVAVDVAPDGSLWFATWEGLSHYANPSGDPDDRGAWTGYTYPDLPLPDPLQSVFVAPDGTVWVGSLRTGVSAFDGQAPRAEPRAEAWTTYTTEDGLVDNHVRAIAMAPDGALWFGTCALWGPAGMEPPPCFGVSRFDGQTWTTYSTEDGLAGDRVNAIAVAPDGALWFGSGAFEFGWGERGGGVSRFAYPAGSTGDGQTWITYTEQQGLADDWVNDVAIAPDGVAWFATAGGVSRFDGQNWTTYTAEDGLISNQVTAVAVAPDGSLWFGTDQGITHFDGTTWTSYVAAGPVDNTVLALAVAPDGTLWAGTGGSGPGDVGHGVSAFDGRTPRAEPRAEAWTAYNTEDGLAANSVNAIAVAPDGAVWFGTGDIYNEGLGVSRYDGKSPRTEAWTTYTTEDGLAGDYVSAIAVTPDGAVWFGTSYGLSRYTYPAGSPGDGGTWETRLGNFGLSDDSVQDLAVGQDGVLWVGSGRSGVHRVGGEGPSPGRDGLAYDWVPAVALEPDGTLWAGTYGKGVSRFDFDAWAWTTFTVDDGLVSDDVYAIAVAPDGAVWFGTGSGLSRYDGQTWTTFTRQDGLADDWVNDIAVGADGALWFATEGGIARYWPSE